MGDLTVKQLQETRQELEWAIAALLKEFTAKTGYSISAVDIERRLGQRYYNGVYSELDYVTKATVDISTEYKHRIGTLVKADTWIDGDSTQNDHR